MKTHGTDDEIKRVNIFSIAVPAAINGSFRAGIGGEKRFGAFLFDGQFRSQAGQKRQVAQGLVVIAV